MNGNPKHDPKLKILSHDLRSPLNAIIGYSELLLETCEDRKQESICTDLRRISQAGRALVGTIHAAFEPGQIEERRQVGDSSVIDAGLDFQIRTSMNTIIGYTELILEDAVEQGYDELALELRKIREAADLFLSRLGAVCESQLQNDQIVPTGLDETTRPPGPAAPNQTNSRGRNCATGEPRHRRQILVVEDEPMNREILSQYLLRLGHEVAMAENGQQALDMVGCRHYDLILLDIIMPVMDGFQVLAQLKADASLRDIPIIVISSLDDPEHIVQGIRMGADDCLPKPFDPVLLGARVEACLVRKGWRDQEQEYLAIIQAEREKSERLLLQMLPAPIAERMKAGETTIADGFEDVAILMSDIVSFTPLTTRMSPNDLVILLNDIFCMFDDLVLQHDLEKIHAYGDEFIVAAGLIQPRKDSVAAVADLALAMVQGLKDYNAGHNCSVEMRIGIDTGPVIAGVIGTAKISYDLWGDAINTASRMQSHGLPGRIHLTEKAYRRLQGKYLCEDRGLIQVKGKGEMHTYFLLGSLADTSR